MSKSLGKATRVLVNDKYGDDMNNDIALVVIAPNASIKLSPIGRVASVQGLALNTKLSVAGFGVTQKNNNLGLKLFINSDIQFQKYSPDSLTTLKKYRIPSGAAFYKEVSYSFAMLGTQSAGKFSTKEWLGTADTSGIYSKVTPVGSCSGDSGGPVLVNNSGAYSIAGVTSFGISPFGTQNCGGGSVYTAVDDYRAWITTTLANFGVKITLQ
jgi:secreted trypsin-like serine protease